MQQIDLVAYSRSRYAEKAQKLQIESAVHRWRVEERWKRARKVETKEDVLEVKLHVSDLPRFATLLESEQTVFKKHWDQIWNSFFESVRKKLRLACGTGQEHDISDSISFLQAGRGGGGGGAFSHC